MKSISQQTQNDILNLLDQGKSFMKIMLEIDVYSPTVDRICSQHCSIIHKAQEDRPSKLNSITICHAIHIISTRRPDTAVQGVESLQETFPEQVSSQMIQRALNKTDLKAVVKARRSTLSKCHHRERLNFAKSHQHFEGLEQGNLVR